jgi:hypothetical protein
VTKIRAGADQPRPVRPTGRFQYRSRSLQSRTTHPATQPSWRSIARPGRCRSPFPRQCRRRCCHCSLDPNRSNPCRTIRLSLANSSQAGLHQWHRRPCRPYPRPWRPHLCRLHPCRPHRHQRPHPCQHRRHQPQRPLHLLRPQPSRRKTAPPPGQAQRQKPMFCSTSAILSWHRVSARRRMSTHGPPRPVEYRPAGLTLNRPNIRVNRRCRQANLVAAANRIARLVPIGAI